jgi:FkbM family methyltransferase
LIIADLRTATGLALYRYGLKDPELDLVRMLLRPSDVFVDAGANIGLFSLIGAAQVGIHGHVYAFEPAPRTSAALIANVELNRYTWTSVQCAALADEPGIESLVTFEGTRSGFSSFAPGGLAGGVSVEATVLTLDEAIPRRQWTRIRLIKIDVEGAELRLLRGARSILSTVGPDMLIELEPAHLSRQGATSRDVECLLTATGYAAYTVHRSGEDGVALRPYRWTGERSSANIFVTRSLTHAEESGILVESN